jgi:IclR family transcriptional regulator, pca regulon regulatory protein
VTGRPGSAAVHRAAAILQELATHPEGITAPELSRRLDTAKSSVTDVVSTMLGQDAVTKDDDGVVRLGRQIVRIARGFVGGTRIIEEFPRSCARIPELDGAAVVLAILFGTDSAHIAVREGARPLPLTLTPGMRLPAWSTATGIALLAELPDGRFEGMFTGPAPVSPSGLTFDHQRLLEACATYRRRGWASNEGVEEMQLSSTAATIRVNRRPIAAVGVVRPLGERRPAQDASAVSRLAQDIAAHA